MLRALGVINAAVWFGGSLFFTLAVGPAFFSDAMLGLLGKPHAGAAAMIVLERYFTLQATCGGLALVHRLVETVYLGRRLLSWPLILLILLLSLGLGAGFYLQPRMQAWHRQMYTPGTAAETRGGAEKSFRAWHGISQGANLVVVVGTFVYLLQITRISDASRYRP